MKIEKLCEAGYQAAMLGLSLSRLQPVEKMPLVAEVLVQRGEPHCKFMRHIKTWWLITAPWYWWKHFEMYQVGVNWPDIQSSSTMYKILSRQLTQDDFETPIDIAVLQVVNEAIVTKDFERAIANLPGAYLYTKEVCADYAAIRNIISQRTDHKLKEWEAFLDAVLAQVEHPELLE